MPTHEQNSLQRSTPQWNIVAHYLIALASVTACYFLYVKFVAPQIEGTRDQSIVENTFAGAGLSVPEINKRVLIPLLPPDAWELEDCKVIITGSDTILFQKTERLENGTLQVVPFTMISGVGESELTAETPAKESSKKSPIVLRCLAGANLKFDRPIEKSFDKDAKLTLARLTGDVDIYRPPSKGDKSDMLHVLTRNVQVDRNRIYTLERVAFSLGNHRGRGRNLMIDLKHDQQVKSARDFSSINGVSRLELAFLEHLRIEPRQSTNELSAPVSPELKKKVFNGKSPIEIRCAGPFVMDMDSDTISFRDQVVATQLDEDRNQISCEQLLVELNKNQNRSDEANSPIDEAEFKRLIATGTPANVIANSYPARFSADELSYESATNKVTGICHGERNVTMLTTREQVVSKQLSCTFDESNELGNVVCSGPGRLLKLANGKTDELFVSWENQLEMRPVAGEATHKKIILAGKTRLKSGSELQIQAEQLELLIKESAKNKDRTEFKPIRATASGDVKFSSPRMSGSTQRLVTTWVEIPLASRARFHRTGRMPMTTGTRNFTGLPIRHQESPQEDSRFVESTARLTGMDSNVRLTKWEEEIPRPRRIGRSSRLEIKPTTVLDFSGRQIDIKLIPTSDSTKTDFTELTISGDVSLTQSKRIVGEPDITAMSLTGDYLKLVPQSFDDEPDRKNRPFKAVLTAKVSPASIETSDVVLKGQRISVDQTSNRIWVTGAGEINFQPLEENESKPKNTINAPFGKPPTQNKKRDKRKLKDFHVRWMGGMIFDGESIYFERQVRMNSTDLSDKLRTETTGFAEAIKVQLNRQIDLQDSDLSQASRDEIRPKEWVLVEWVTDEDRAFGIPLADSDQPLTNPSGELVFKSSSYDTLTGQQKAQQVIQARRAMINSVDQKVTAVGPGKIAVHQLNPPKSKTRKNGSAQPMSRLAVSSKRRPISFMQINFDGKLHADGSGNKVGVEERIRAAYVDVDNWQQGIDPDHAQKQSAEGVVLMTCSNLDLARWQPRGANKPTHEMLASGNVRVDSESLEAESDRLSYDQLTDSLVIEGTPISDAKIWYRRKNDSSIQKANVQKGTYRISDQSFEAILKSAVIQK